MAMKVTRVDVWAAQIPDKPGGIAAKLDKLSKTRGNLEFVLARREKRGKGVVFVTPISGTKRQAAARRAGFKKSKSIFTLKIESADKPGLGAKITAALAEQCINLHGLTAGVIGKKAIVYLSVDSAADANKAARLLRAMK